MFSDSATLTFRLFGPVCSGLKSNSGLGLHFPIYNSDWRCCLTCQIKIEKIALKPQINMKRQIPLFLFCEATT